MTDSNWNSLFQGILDDVADIKKKVRKEASNDIIARLVKEGVPANKLSFNGKAIVAQMATEDEYEAGKIYFNKVMQDIDNGTWIEKL